MSSAYPIRCSNTTSPIVFTHNTKNLKVTTLLNQTLNIKGCCKYSIVNGYCIWDIPITDERTINFKTLEEKLKTHYSTTISDVAKLILKHKIVYFENLTHNYINIIKDVSTATTNELFGISNDKIIGMRSSKK